VGNAVASVGGVIEAFYYAFADIHLYVIAEFPDSQAAAAVALTASSTGHASCHLSAVLSRPFGLLGHDN
jgi:uncharacterized protein with GYD domain